MKTVVEVDFISANKMNVNKLTRERERAKFKNFFLSLFCYHQKEDEELQKNLIFQL
jgi:hypothetical protein